MTTAGPGHMLTQFFSLSRAAVVALMFFLMLPQHAYSAPATTAQGNSWSGKVQSNRPLAVLLIGNSHLLMPGFIKRLKSRLKDKSAKGRSITVRKVAKIGTTLTKSRKKKSTLQAMRATKWDIVVLQESTTAFMTKHGRRNYMTAVDWYRKNMTPSAKLVLWQTWPQGARHALYHRRGVWGKWFKNPPRNPKQPFSWISKGTAQAAEARGAYVAPIGRCWMSLPVKKRPYAGDRYHPSNKGIRYIAEILSRSVISAANGEPRDPLPIAKACP